MYRNIYIYIKRSKSFSLFLTKRVIKESAFPLEDLSLGSLRLIPGKPFPESLSWTLKTVLFSLLANALVFRESYLGPKKPEARNLHSKSNLHKSQGTQGEQYKL